MKRGLRALTAAAAVAALSLGMVGCSGESSSSKVSNKLEEASKTKEVNIGYIAWDEDIAVSHLWSRILKDEGYKVKMTQFDVAPTYIGLSKGDVNLFLDAWLPTLHEDYMKKYGKDIEDLGAWYKNTRLSIAVPTYMEDINSIADLKANASKFKNTLTGIEPGAGIMKSAKNKVIPEYGLKDMKLVASSTPAMLAELKKATDAKKPIAVLLWRPHWAYTVFPIKDLEDPKKTFGETEQIHSLAPKGFSTAFPKVAGMVKKFKMDDDQLGSLEDLVLRKYKDDPAKGVDEWLKANPDFVKSLK